VKLGAFTAILTSLLLSSGVASAATIDFGTVSAGNIYGISGQGSGTPGSTAVLDTYIFDVGTPLNFHAAAVDLVFNSFNFASLIGELFDEDPTTCGSCSALATASGADSFHLNFGELIVASDYFLRVSGKFGSGGAGIYGGVMAVGAVPIPGAVWLFGSGLAGLAALNRRRKSRKGEFRATA
jgi:hypothetical protein